MNEVNESTQLKKLADQRIDKIRALVVFLLDLERMAKSDLLSQETRDQLQPIIREVMKKIKQSTID